MKLVVEYFIREHFIVFDAIYTRLLAFKRSDEYCNYNQIYADFGLISPESHGEPDSRIVDFVILVAPILLTHEEIKEADDDFLTQHAPFEGYT